MTILHKLSAFNKVLITLVLFVILFYRQSIGINLLLFELIMLLLLDIKPVIESKHITSHAVLLGTFVTAIIVVIHNTILSIFINLLSFFLLIGVLVYPSAKSMLTVYALGFSSVIRSIPVLFQHTERKRSKSSTWRKTWRWFKIVFIPLIVVIIFTQMYSSSSPFFDELYQSFLSKFDGFWKRFFELFEFSLLLMIILGGITGTFLFMRSSDIQLIEKDKNSTDQLERKRKNKGRFKLPYLKYELRSAMLLMIMLNVLILIVNVLDIYKVWFSFEWNGQYLKQFVHEGTYVLIFSILLSILLVLFYFRGNLNFYRNNRWLKVLASIWLAQNVVLAVSVAIRNLRYIEYFSLAYKRIAVIFFLALIITGLITVYLKIKERKSTFYLLRWNSLAVYIAFLVGSLFNWDVIIARYNFAHYKGSFVHLNFLSTLSNKALPYLDKSLEELKVINSQQQAQFDFREKYMSPERYFKIIDNRKLLFMEQHNNKKLLSWNYAEYITFRKLAARQK